MQHEHNKAEDSEIRKWKRNLIGAWAFTFPTAVLMIFSRIFGSVTTTNSQGWLFIALGAAMPDFNNNSISS